VTITTPNGQATFSNPIYAYTFLDTPENNGIPLGTSGLPTQVNTVRYWDPHLQQSNQTAANATLLAQANNIRSYVYNMLTVAEDYSTFSYAASSSDSGGHNIEYLHGGIHVAIGGTVNGGGTMSWLPVAAFDPTFYLHHANVDRLIAMWQALNPDSYIVPTANAGSGSYYELSGTLDSGNSST
jgi:tyrosinase